jgi:hypothetical protein
MLKEIIKYPAAVLLVAVTLFNYQQGNYWVAIPGAIILLALGWLFLKPDKPDESPEEKNRKILADPNAAVFGEEMDDEIEVIEASVFKTIIHDFEGHRGGYNLLSLGIPLNVVDDFFSSRGFKSYSKIYVSVSSNLYLCADTIAWDGLIIRHTGSGIIRQMFWSYHGDETRVKEALKDFPSQYPLIWVDWLDGVVDCLNSSNITGMPHWKQGE